MEVNYDIKRYESKYSNYVQAIIDGDEMLQGLYDVIDKSGGADKLEELISVNELYAFALSNNEAAIGFFCLCDFNWEDRNCRLKGGILKKYQETISPDIMMMLIKRVLGFCTDELRLKRVWGTLHKDSMLERKYAEEAFKVEGTDIRGSILYLGYTI